MKLSLPIVGTFLTFITLSVASCKKNPATDESTNVSTIKDAIIYTDLNPDSLVIWPNDGVYALDLNSDGIADFVFNSAFGTTCRDDMLGTYAYSFAISVRPAKEQNTIVSSGTGLALALDLSDVITSYSMWGPTSQLLFFGITSGSGHCISNSAYASSGRWLNVSDKYLGLKFTRDNNTYYGWARLTSSYRIAPTSPRFLVPGQLIIKDYAYNSTPNQPILAGQMQ